VIGSKVHASARSEVTDVAGVPGTTWKKKSRQGSPEVTNVGDLFSVRVFAGGGLVGLLKLASFRSRNASPEVGAAAATRAVAAQRLSAGGPRRVKDTARRHAAAAMVWRLGFGAWVLVVLLSEINGKGEEIEAVVSERSGVWQWANQWLVVQVARGMHHVQYLISNERVGRKMFITFRPFGFE
jgi:hypothetical protein